MVLNVSILTTLISACIAFIALLRLFSHDSKNSVKDFQRVETKLDYIGGDTKEIRDDVKALKIKQEDMAERLVKVEESTKSAHHRIDNMEEKIK